MNVLHDDAGKAYIPASDFYKNFISDQLIYAVKLGKAKYDEVQFNLFSTLIGSDTFKMFEKSFQKELLLLSKAPYEVMKGSLADTETTVEESENYPKLRLVK